MKILILGGYGVFGGRLAQLLKDLPDLTLLICGRSLAKAQAFCGSFQGAAKVVPTALDRGNIANALAQLHPDLVVDASGPFQDYGTHRYQVIEACVAARVNYLDFADGADFVFGVPQFDQAARDAGVFVLSGVSSFPVLTAAVLREFGKSMDVQEVLGGIAPSPYAGIGLNVMRAVVGYAGAPVKLWRGGVSATGIGLGESVRYTIAPPGQLPLRSIRFSLVDVPDLQVIPPEHPGLQSIWMGAGPVPEVLHKILNLLAKARHLLKLPSFEAFSPLFYWVLNRMKFGEHRGGMFVAVRGMANGKPVARSWHLLAEGDDGPFIPSMAIEAIVRKGLSGTWPEPGARAATRALDLADYDQLFKARTITTGYRDDQAHGPLYRRMLGGAFDTLPEPAQALHATSAARQWSGTASVQRGKGLLANLVAALIGFPNTGEDVPVSVRFEPQGEAELWTRTFAGKSFSSLQFCGSGKNQHLLVERFGLLDVAVALTIEEDRLHLVPRRWSFLGLPLPHWLLPRGQTFETGLDGTFRFSVAIEAPCVGRIVAYNGALSPQS